MVPVTQYNFDYENMILESNSHELMTIPDQALSLEEIFRRSNAGTLPDIALEGQWDEDPNLDAAIRPDFDLTDLDATNELIESLKARYEAEKALQEEGKNFSESEPPVESGE